jgi:DNA-binding winged helix-turn-helix (wHTH) protein/Tol biopolymer transport system component
MNRVGKNKVVAFGDFQLDLGDGTLRQNGSPVSLSPKEFETLRLLVENSPHVVTKEEFIARIWPDTFVGDSSLARNVSVLRKLLGNDMIETVAKRGYRFTAATTLLDPADVVSQPSDQAPAAVEIRRYPSRWRWWAAGWIAFSLVIVILAASYWWPRRRPDSIPELRLTQLTLNSNQKPVRSGVISPDGKYLAYSDLDGIHLELIETGELRTIATSAEGKENHEWRIVGWLAGNTSFVANLSIPDQSHDSVWVYSILGESPHQLRDNTEAWSTSRDGSLILFGSKFLRSGPSEIWAMDANGEHEQKLFEAEPNTALDDAKFSADGRYVVYVKHLETGADPIEPVKRILETRAVKSGTATRIVSALNISGHDWLPDGRLIYGLAESNNADNSNYWAVQLDPSSGRPKGPTRRLTNWAGFHLNQISATSDGKRLAFLASVGVVEEYLAEYSTGGHISTPKRLALDGMNGPISWTPDSKAILLVSVRNGHQAIFKQTLESGSIQPIVASKEQHAMAPRVTPDGASILYFALPDNPGSSTPWGLMRVPISGGPSQFLVQTDGEYRCPLPPAWKCIFSDRSADRRQVIWKAVDPLKGPLDEVARMDTDVDSEYDWALSADGKTIVTRKDREANVAFLDLTSHKLRHVAVNGWRLMTNLDWSPDGKGFFTCGIRPQGSVLLYVDLNGKAQPIWEYSGNYLWGLLSPNGRHLAMGAQTEKNNMWVMENF